MLQVDVSIMNFMGTHWETQKKSDTPTLPQKRKKPGPSPPWGA